MANYSYYGTAVNGKQLRMDITTTPNPSGNYTDVRQVLYIICNQWVSDSNMQVGQAIGGVQTYWSDGYKRFEAGTSVIADSSRRITHNANGAASVTLTGAAYAAITGQVNVSVTVSNLSLPTFPRIPSAPTRPAASAITHNSMTLKFSKQGSIPSTKHELQRSTSSNFSGATTVSSNGTTSVTGLTPGTTYYYRARSGSAAGWSGWSATLSVPTKMSPNAPIADTITATSARVRPQWSGGSASFKTWEIQRSLSSNFASPTTVKTTSTHTFTGLNPGTRYYVRARAQNSSGWSSWSSGGSFVTAGLAAPGLTIVSDPMGASAKLTIKAPTGASISFYTVEYEYLTPAPKPNPSVFNLRTGSLTPTVTSLVPGAAYRWRVRAHVGDYSTAWSGWTTVTQPNPASVDDLYFDEDSKATGLTYGTALLDGVQVLAEKAVAPTAWNSSVSASLRQVSGNLGPAAGSSKSARFRAFAGSHPYPRELLIGGEANTLDGETHYSGVPVLPEATYSAHVTVKADRTTKLTFSIAWLHSLTGGIIIERASTPEVTVAAGRVVPLSVMGRSPGGTVAAVLIVHAPAQPPGSLVPEPITIEADNAHLGLGRIPAAFNGGTADDSHFTYSWAGTKWNSVSLRTPRAVPLIPDPFRDPSRPAPPVPPRPPVPNDEGIPSVPSWRRFLSPISSGQVPAAFDSLPTFTLTTGSRADGPVRISIFENPGDLPPEEFLPEDPVSVQMVAYLPAESTAYLDAVAERAFGQLQGSDELVPIDHLVRGVAGGPPTWPVLRCGSGYMIAVDVPSPSPIGNIELTAEITARMGG